MIRAACPVQGGGSRLTDDIVAIDQCLRRRQWRRGDRHCRSLFSAGPSTFVTTLAKDRGQLSQYWRRIFLVLSQFDDIDSARRTSRSGWEAEGQTVRAHVHGPRGWSLRRAVHSRRPVRVLGGPRRRRTDVGRGDGRCLHVLEGHQERIRHLRLTADLRNLLSAGDDGLRLWHLDCGWRPTDGDAGAQRWPIGPASHRYHGEQSQGPEPAVPGQPSRRRSKPRPAGEPAGYILSATAIDKGDRGRAQSSSRRSRSRRPAAERRSAPRPSSLRHPGTADRGRRARRDLEEQRAREQRSKPKQGQGQGHARVGQPVPEHPLDDDLPPHAARLLDDDPQVGDYTAPCARPVARVNARALELTSTAA